MVVVAVTGRWSRSVRHAVGHAGRSHVVLRSIGRSAVRWSGVCSCGTRRSRSRTGYAWSILMSHTGGCLMRRSTRRSTCRAEAA